MQLCNTKTKQDTLQSTGWYFTLKTLKVSHLTTWLTLLTSLTEWKGNAKLLAKLLFSLISLVCGAASGTWQWLTSLTPWSSGCSSMGSTLSSASRMLAMGMSEIAPQEDSVSPSPLSPFVLWRSSWKNHKPWRSCFTHHRQHNTATVMSWHQRHEKALPDK